MTRKMGERAVAQKPQTSRMGFAELQSRLLSAQVEAAGPRVDWDDLRYFLKVAETGGLSPAARFLRVNTTTVGRHIEALEVELGQKLFARTAQGYRLTDAGERLLEWSRKVEIEFTNIQAAFSATPAEVTGTVSIATTDWVAIGFLIDTLPEFRRRHPGIDLDIAAAVDPVNLSRREADVALRLFRPDQGNLIARRIGELGHGLYASAQYLERHGMPDLSNACEGHALIDWPQGLEATPPVAWARRHAAKARPVLRGNASVRLSAARAGLGLSVLAHIGVPRDEGLVKLAIEPVPPPLGLWLVSHAELAHLPRIRAVIDHIAAAAEAKAAYLRDGMA
jgi:DNA-binding transcriptional LysR family regulator